MQLDDTISPAQRDAINRIFQLLREHFDAGVALENRVGSAVAKGKDF